MGDETYKSLFENSYSVMLIVHPETGRIVDANKAACRYYGYSPETLKSMFIQDINTLTKEQIFEEMQRAKTESRNYFHFRHRLANGRLRHVEVYSGPLVINGEKVLYSIVHDISERKLMERQVALERQFSESLINSLPGVMYVFDQLGNFKRWNENLEHITGYSSDQIENMNPLDFIAPQDKPRVRAAIGKVFDEGQASVEAGLSTIDGQIIPYLLTGYRFVELQLNYLVGVGLDISDRIRTEKEKENLIAKLQETLSQVKQLSGLLPICAACKNIRDDKGYWNKIEAYIKAHSEAEFSHGICPDCARKLYPDLVEDDG
jgi:PAS domain S-box-containing protein